MSRLKLQKYVALAAMAGAILIGGLFLVAWLRQETTMRNYYNDVLHNTWWNKDLVAHFPDPIPPEATGVQVFYFPGFMQGGPEFQVHFRLPPEKISRLYEELGAQAIYRFKAGDAPREVFVPPFLADGRAGHPFPATYEIFVFKNEGANHRKICGVAIDRTTNDIVYWADAG